MSNTTLPLHKQVSTPTRPRERVTGATPTWWIIFTREMTDMWVGGKGLVLLFIYSVVLGLLSYVLASNSELSLIPPKEMVFLILQTAFLVGGFIAAIMGADSISGERERATLEALLITPTSRLQLVVGKYLAAISPWPAAMLITIPYLRTLAQGDEVFGQAVFWGFVFGTLLTVGYSGVGMLASIWSASNRTSLGVSLLLYILCALPVQFPGNTQTGVMGRFLKAANPMEAVDHVLEKLLVNNRTLDELATYFWSPILLPILVLSLLLLFAAPQLRLDAGVPWPSYKGGHRRVNRGAVVLLFVLLYGAATTATALAATHLMLQPQVPETVVALPLSIAVDKRTVMVKTGDKVPFQTTVTNNGTAVSPPLILAMNIINLDADGDVVDPEDWSPERTQYLAPLAPGVTAEQEWQLNTILGGDYMVYMVLIPAPDSPTVTSRPLTSAGIHVTVEVVLSTNPSGIAPYAIGMPTALLSLIVGINIYRRRQVEAEG